MMVQTVKLYDCYPQLMYSFTESSNTMTLNCIEVTSQLTACRLWQRHEYGSRPF